jgi:type VI secretion system protein ImpJ
MFMSPQHLQRQDAYHEARLDFRIAAISSLSWGVVHYELEASALKSGHLRVTRFTGVLPDFVVMSFSAEDGEGPEARAIAPHLPPTASHCDVYLAVPREREGVPNYGAAGDGLMTRWARQSRQVIDAASAVSDALVDFGAPNVQVLFGDEARGDFEAIKIAEVRRGASGEFEFVEDYVPPCLRMSASAYLMEELSKLLSLVVARQRGVAEATRQRDSSSVEFMGSDITRFLLLNALNGSIPVIRYMSEAGGVAPQQVYMTLIGLAGQLATFSEAEVGDLPLFMHTDLRATFGPLFARLHQLLAASIMENYVPLRLAKQSDGSFTGVLKDERLLDCKSFYLSVKSNLGEKEAADMVPKLAKIASQKDLGGYIQAALPGVRATVSYRPPAQIPVRSGVSYFELDLTRSPWKSVLFEKTFAVYLPPPFAVDDLELQLLGIPG